MSHGLFPPVTRAITVGELSIRLPQYRWPFGVERDFQNAVAEWLTREGVTFEREYSTGHGPIDFYLPDNRIGLELKVKGSPAAVLRQLQRYAQSDAIDALVLLTGKATLKCMATADGSSDRRRGTIDYRLNGKPVTVVSTWAGGL